MEAAGLRRPGAARVAGLYELDGDRAAAAELARARRAVEGLLERFWLEDRGYYAMAIDGEGRPSGALASNQGHLLWAGAVPPERARAVRDALMGEELFTGWGIRTWGGPAAYNPVGYHLGTVWPHDTAHVRRRAARVRHGRGLHARLRGPARRGLACGGLPPARTVPPASRERSTTRRCRTGRLPAAGLGRRRDPVSARSRAGAERRWAQRAAARAAASLPRHVDRVDVEKLPSRKPSVDLRFERATGGQVVLTDARIEGDVQVALEIRGSRT